MYLNLPRTRAFGGSIAKSTTVLTATHQDTLT